MRCPWIIVTVMIPLLSSSVSLAQPPVQAKDGKLTVSSTVSPAPAAVPALKYLLLPDLRDQQPGNQVQSFYKCFMQQHNFYRDKTENEKREKWSIAPLADLVNEKSLIDYGGSSLRQADYAARLESVDWQILLQFKEEGIRLLLPDIQTFRELAQALNVRARGEIARKEYDSAIRTMQTMFVLASTFNQHPTLIGQLVGIAITNITLGLIQEFQQQPDSPSLFWALADLPSPLINLRKGMQGERMWLKKENNLLLKTEPIPEAMLNRQIKEMNDWVLMEEGDKKKPSASEYFTSKAKNSETVTVMKENLVKLGYKQAELDKLSNLQIAMMDDYIRYVRFRDDLMKWTNQPYWEIPSDIIQIKAPEGIYIEYTPSVIKLIQIRTRLQQYQSLLQIVEAIRIFSAENKGKLPATLAEMKLPLPIDPITGKPFSYEMSDGKAVIRGSTPVDQKNNPSFNRVFEVKIRP